MFNYKILILKKREREREKERKKKKDQILFVTIMLQEKAL